MRQIVRHAAEYYALQAISLQQLTDVCDSKEELCEALIYADAYAAEYESWCNQQNEVEDVMFCRICGELIRYDGTTTILRINGCLYELKHKDHVTFIKTSASRYKIAQVFKDLKVAINGSYYVSYHVKVIESKNGIAVIVG